MRFANSLKTLLRSPAKTLVTFVLLVATSFAFVSRGVEYAATVRQISAAEAQYTAVGTVEKTVQGYTDWMTETVGEEVSRLEDGVYLDRTDRAIVPLENGVQELLSESKYIGAEETRLVSGGTHPEYLSVFEQPLSDLEQYDPNDKYTTSGTFAMSDVVFLGRSNTNDSNSRMLVWSRKALSMYPDTFYISKTQTGDPMTESYTGVWDDFYYWTRNNTKPELEKYWDTLYEHWQKDDMFLFVLGGGNGNDRSILPCIDYPMINLSRIEREYGETDLMTILKNPAAYGCPHYSIPDWDSLVNKFNGKHLSLFYPIPHSDDEMTNIFDYFTTVERNRHTSEVVYTSDMALIHKVHSQDMYASAGRLLTAEDSGDVCVVGADFAELNDLHVGDSITLDLCADTMVHSGKVFGRETPFPTDRDVVSENQLTERNLENVTKTFEIVGIWSDSGFDVEDPFTYALNTIFVPDDCYPWAGQVEPSALPSTFSFRLKNPGDVAAMEDELGDELAALGYELSINDGGYAAAKPNLDFMKLTALIGFIGMCLALLLALILITYLFIIRKKKDYAIMRALGTTRGRSNRSLLGALLTMSAVAVTIGAVLAGVVAQGSTARMAAEVAEITGEVASTDSSWILTAAFAAGTLALVWLFARVGLARISRTPPLELLQGR